MAFLFIVPDFRGIVNILPKVCRICGGGSARRPAEMTTADLPKDGKPPLTFPPDLAFKKGSVTAAAAAYNPSGGFLLYVTE